MVYRFLAIVINSSRLLRVSLATGKIVCNLSINFAKLEPSPRVVG